MSPRRNSSLSIAHGSQLNPQHSQPTEQPGLRILITRFGSIGDVILTLPVACALRSQFPDAHLAWAVHGEATPLVQHHQAVDEVIELPMGWWKSVSRMRETRRVLRMQHFDISLDCEGTTSSSLVGWLSGAKRRIGLRRSSWLSGNRLCNNEFITPVFHHATDQSLELLTALEVHHPQVRWDVPVSSEDQKWARGYRATISSRHLAILNPGGVQPNRSWEPHRFASTARYIADRYGYHSLVSWGTFEERLLAEEIVSLSSGTATLAPDTSLLTLAAMIETADLFLSGDTGPLHLAVAVGTKTIGLYGASQPAATGPHGHSALQIDGQPQHGHHSGDPDSNHTIGVEHVCALIDELHIQELSQAA